jgi:hypothetical protein
LTRYPRPSGLSSFFLLWCSFLAGPEELFSGLDQPFSRPEQPFVGNRGREAGGRPKSRCWSGLARAARNGGGAGFAGGSAALAAIYVVGGGSRLFWVECGEQPPLPPDHLRSPMGASPFPL